LPPYNPQKIKEKDKKLKKTKTTEGENIPQWGKLPHNPQKAKEKNKDLKSK